MHQINISPGGVPKLSVPAARLGWLGLSGDGHRDLKHHGGPDRALCLYSLELIQELAAEGHSVTPGALGENLTLRGIPFSSLAPGDRLEIGETLVELTAYTTPCRNILPYFLDGYIARVHHAHHPGWSRLYARVIRPGMIRQGDGVRLQVDGTQESGVSRPSTMRPESHPAQEGT